MMRDLHDNIELRPAINPTRVTDNTPQVSAIIDVANAAALEFAIAIGTIASGTATFQVLVEDGNTPTLTDNATVDPSQLLGIVGVAATPTGASFRYDSDNQVRKIGYIGAKRYVRLTITPAVNAANADISCIAILSRERKGPQSNQAA
jgi:hypothetical protein